MLPIRCSNVGRWLARILQHEVDRLSGELYIDVMNTHSFISKKEFALQWADKLAKDLTVFTKTGALFEVHQLALAIPLMIIDSSATGATLMAVWNTKEEV